MNSALVSLELRKNRLTLIGLGAAFALVPALSILMAPRYGLGTGAAVEAGLMLWTTAGMPLAAVFLGAIAGAGLRDAANRDAEAALPGSPDARVYRGLAGAVLQLLFIAACTAAFSALVSPGWRGGVLGIGDAPQVWTKAAPMRGLLVFLAFDLLAGSFVASYALGHAFAGGLIGVALSGAEAAGIALGLQYALLFPDRVGSFTSLAVLAASAGLVAKLAAARPLASRFERVRPMGPAGAARTALLLAAGLLVAWGAEESTYRALRSSLRLLKPSWTNGFLSIGPSPEDARAALFPAVREADALATTAAGGLFRLGKDGRPSRLLPDAEVGRFTMFRALGTRVVSAAYDPAGRLFVSRSVENPPAANAPFRWLRVSGGDEWWIAPSGGPVRRIAASRGEVEDVVRQGEDFRAVLFDRDAGKVFCAILDDGSLGRCGPGTEERPWMEPTRGLPAAAVIGPDAHTLARGAPHPRTWRLPGRALYPKEPVQAYLVGGKPAYFVEFAGADDASGMAVCSEDGAVTTRWPRSFSGAMRIGGLDLDVLPDGSLVYQFAYDWNVVDPDGNFVPLIRSKKLFERWPRTPTSSYHTPRLVRRAGGHAWVVFEARLLVEIEEGTGMPLKSWDLPFPWSDRNEDMRILPSGLILQDTTTAAFIGWDGATRSLRAL